MKKMTALKKFAAAGLTALTALSTLSLGAFAMTDETTEKDGYCFDDSVTDYDYSDDYRDDEFSAFPDSENESYVEWAEYEKYWY